MIDTIVIKLKVLEFIDITYLVGILSY